MNLSSILATKAAPYTLEVDGVVYPISHLTQAKKAEFERWLKRETLKELELEREFFDGETWEKGLREFRKNASSALYSFHGDLASEALDSPAGSLVIAQILFGQPEDKILEIFAKKGSEARQLLSLVLAESLPREADPASGEPGEEGGEGADPNAPGPAA